MDDVRLAKLADEQRPVNELRHERADVLDGQRVPQRPRRNRIDRDEPRADVRVVPPRGQQAIGLDGLATQDS
jgi:hypothetical protein